MNGHTPMPTIRWLAATAALTLLAGCGPTAGATTNTPEPSTPNATPSSSPSATTPSPSPTSTLSADQQAAVDALTASDSTYNELAANPASFSEKEIRARLKKVTAEPALSNFVGYVLKLKRSALREQGSAVPLSLKVSGIEKVTGGVRVVITRCLDQRGLAVVKKDGSKGPASYQVPEWQVQESALRKTDGTWRQTGTRPVSTKKCA